MPFSRCRRLQADRTRESLEAGTEDGLLRGARAALAANDELVREHVAELRAASRLACASGCMHCCHLDVSASLPEIAAVASFIEETFSDAELAALRQRLDAQCASDRSLSSRDRAMSSRRCSLLVDDRCSVYEARPLACRGWNSADVEPCIVALLDPGAPPSIPVHRRIRDTALAVAAGMRDGVREAGLDDRPLDLPIALRSRLDEGPAMLQRWLEGKRLPDALEAKPGPRRDLDAAGRWQMRAEGGDAGPGRPVDEGTSARVT